MLRKFSRSLDLDGFLGRQLKLKKMDMRFGTWNFRSMYRADLLRTVEEDTSKCK
jgi:hypothetical protein